MTPILLWFRQDLRLQDNPALRAALERGGPVLPVYIHDPEAEGRWAPGGASRWWLHHALAALDQSLRERGSRLTLARGAAAEVLRELARRTGATALYWNRRYEPGIVARDAGIKREWTEEGREARSFGAALLHEPHAIANKQGRPFQVFTPYWRHCLELPVEAPWRLAGGTQVPAPTQWPRSLSLEELDLLPRVPWDGGLRSTWAPGEAGAAARLRQFVRTAMEHYADRRNLPGCDGTSMLSPWLHFGELSPRQVWAAVQALSRDSGVFPPHNGARVFLSEVGWREFAHHLLYHFPHTPEQPLRSDFAAFPWADDPGGHRLRAWQRGRTGYPIVDAGMRQLWHTGWMHNRVRMIVASFLVKHLRLPWQHGAAWFWDTLVDADLASNTLGWQWSAGCGADAAPYFRVFAPVLQGRKFDPDGAYVRHWVPELARLPAEHLHAPWEAPSADLRAAGVRLGPEGDYPLPIVDHAKARSEALAAFRQLRGSAVVERE
ncbi:MAG: deoxyribodipyrimidine photo-lyase [Verrucomicrobia bacterium]|nr:deoxyribodipyrimidine photo-lyase [Verrucomicrobiota bacterium]